MPFLAHEQQWYRGRQQQQRQAGTHRRSRRQDGQSFAERTITDLIMILQEGHESRRREMLAYFATSLARPELRRIVW